MDRVGTAPPSVGTAFGVGEEGSLPARAGNAGLAAQEKRGTRSWLGVAGRIVRNAAIAVVLMALVPATIITWNGDKIWRMAQYGVNTRAKTVIAERTRPLALPRDASITPARAGQAFALLQTQRKDASTLLVNPASRPARTWEALKLTDAMFASARPDQYAAAPASGRILEAVEKGFSPEEKEYLRVMATAPVWREFDIVARAPAVDMVGGYLKFPLPADARWEQLPILQFRATKELAYASLSRAAYHMSVGQRDSAENALRAVVSVGFAMVDNGTNLMDQLIGDVMVGIGRDGLRRFYEITGDARAGSAAVASPEKVDVVGPSIADIRTMPVDELRRRVIARATDPTTPRGERFETVRMLNMSSCSSVRDIIMGPPADVRNAVDAASRILGRFPSERELVRLAAQPLILKSNELPMSPPERLVASISAVPAAVLNKPQLPTCTLIAASRFFAP